MQKNWEKRPGGGSVLHLCHHRPIPPTV